MNEKQRKFNYLSIIQSFKRFSLRILVKKYFSIQATVVFISALSRSHFFPILAPISRFIARFCMIYWGREETRRARCYKWNATWNFNRGRSGAKIISRERKRGAHEREFCAFRRLAQRKPHSRSALANSSSRGAWENFILRAPGRLRINMYSAGAVKDIRQTMLSRLSPIWWINLRQAHARRRNFLSAKTRSFRWRSGFRYWF
jgi:hypothetical protein